MKIKKDKASTIVEAENSSFEHFFNDFELKYNDLEENNIIIDLSTYKNLNKENIKVFLPTSQSQKKSRKSLVLVIENFDFNKVNHQLVVVPTLQEAHDVIELDEIERDLGI
jgi:hypothetical protein